MAKSKSKDTTVRPSLSRAIGNGEYERVYKLSDATGVNVHRNDATAKKFKAEVERLADKLEGFTLHSQDKDRALFVRQRAMSVDDLIDEAEQAPF